MRSRKMSEQELRMWCIDHSTTQNAHIFWEQVEELYKYVTQKEQKESQKKPHECIFCRLSSWFHGLLKQL